MTSTLTCSTPLKESLIDKITQLKLTKNWHKKRSSDFSELLLHNVLWLLQLIHYANKLDSIVLIHCPRTRKLTNNVSLLRKNPSTIARVNVSSLAWINGQWLITCVCTKVQCLCTKSLKNGIKRESMLTVSGCTKTTKVALLR